MKEQTKEGSKRSGINIKGTQAWTVQSKSYRKKGHLPYFICFHSPLDLFGSWCLEYSGSWFWAPKFET